VQQHRYGDFSCLIDVMIMFDAQLWLYAQLLVGDDRQHAWRA